jgi:predicted neuraminidase
VIQSAKKTLIDIPTASGHASTIALCRDDILLAWFGGTQEGAPDVDIYTARRHKGIWDAPHLIAGEADLPHWNPVFYARGDTIDLFYKVGTPIPRWHTRRMRSTDGGWAWTQPTELVQGDVGGRGPVRNKPLRLQSGRMLAPASVETAEQWNAFVDISDDDCETFRPSPFVPLWRKGEPLPRGCKKPPFETVGKGVIQPTLWQSVDGAVHMLLRSTEGYILRSDSVDDGETWCFAYSTGIPNNNSGIDLAQAEDGCIFLVSNPVSGNWAARTPLLLSFSADGGETFRPLLYLETNEGEYSYPAILSKGKTLFVSYTWKRQKIAFWEIETEARL